MTERAVPGLRPPANVKKLWPIGVILPIFSSWPGQRTSPITAPSSSSKLRSSKVVDPCCSHRRAMHLNSVRVLSSAGTTTSRGQASPEIVISDQPCVMCDGLVCASVCASGALVSATPETMRLAEVTFQAEICWASQGVDPGGNYCFDRCPMRGRAITYRQGRGPKIYAEACTGCGTCSFFCPRKPKSDRRDRVVGNSPLANLLRSTRSILDQDDVCFVSDLLSELPHSSNVRFWLIADQLRAVKRRLLMTQSGPEGPPPSRRRKEYAAPNLCASREGTNYRLRPFKK